MTDDNRTLFKVKIRASRMTREVACLMGMLIGIGVGLVAIGGLQVMACKSESPRMSVMACLAPHK